MESMVGGEYSTHGRKICAYRTLTGKAGEKKHIQRS
jgi:hypothetical protein